MTVTLYQGDCLDVMRDLPSGGVDAVVTDPPHGIDGGRGGQARERGKGKYSPTSWIDNEDYIADVVVPVIRECIRIARRVVVTPGVRCLHLYPRASDIGCFWTPAATGCGTWGFSTFHPILYYGKDHRAGRGALPNGKQVTERAEQNAHPCPKPLGAWTWLVDKASIEGETVLDPFMGSGTTGVACVQTGRSFIGIEIDPGYFAIAQRRIAEAQQQIPLPLGGRDR